MPVSIHAPHAGRDKLLCFICFVTDVSIHAPHAGRDHCVGLSLSIDLVSIHAPHAGRDDNARRCARARFGFNPRAPYGARQR